MISNQNTRLPYKDDNNDDLYTLNPKEEEGLEDKVVDESEEQSEAED